MDKPKPTIILVPGAWHIPAHYDKILQLLQDFGYPIGSVNLPSVNSSIPINQTLTIDTDAIRQTLLAFINQGKDVILLMHSYGGAPGGAAAKGLSRAERTAESGAIIGIIYLAAFIVKEGQSVVQANMGEINTWAVDKGDGQLVVQDPVEVFWHDVPTEWQAQEIQPQALQSVITPCPPIAWDNASFDGRRGYIITTQDRAVLPSLQHMMLERSEVEWKLREIDSSHCPFLSKPEELVECIIGMISLFEDES